MPGVIKHQTQPCPVSCVTTCIAMILNQPVADLIPLMHEQYHEGLISIREILVGKGVEFEAFYSLDTPSLCEEGVYLCTAPSLNIVAGTHQILVEVHEDGYAVHDPVRGREGRKYYVVRRMVDDPPLTEDQVELGGFIVDAFIPRSWLDRLNS